MENESHREFRGGTFEKSIRCVYNQRSLENLKPMICKSPPVHETRSSHEPSIQPTIDRPGSTYSSRITHISPFYIISNVPLPIPNNVRNHVRVTAGWPRVNSVVVPHPENPVRNFRHIFRARDHLSRIVPADTIFLFRGRNSESTRGCTNANNFLEKRFGSLCRNFPLEKFLAAF